MVCGDETDHVITYAASDSQYRFLVSRGCRDFADAWDAERLLGVAGHRWAAQSAGRGRAAPVPGAVEMAKNPSRSWIACRWSAHPKQQPKCLPRGCSAAGKPLPSRPSGRGATRVAARAAAQPDTITPRWAGGGVIRLGLAHAQPHRNTRCTARPRQKRGRTAQC